MKIEKQVEAFVEVEVDIGLDEISQAIREMPVDDDYHVSRGITSCWQYLSAVPDSLIAAMNDAKKKTIYDALTKEVKRFAPTVTVNDGKAPY